MAIKSCGVPVTYTKSPKLCHYQAKLWADSIVEGGGLVFSTMLNFSNSTDGDLCSTISKNSLEICLGLSKYKIEHSLLTLKDLGWIESVEKDTYRILCKFGKHSS